MAVDVTLQANGSAVVELGGTKVLASVHGPRGASNLNFSESAVLSCDVKFAAFAAPTRRDYAQDDDERKLSLTLQSALAPAVRLAKYPKSSIDVSVLVLQSSGSALAAAVTCASLALAAAGIEMFDLVTCCSVAVRPCAPRRSVCVTRAPRRSLAVRDATHRRCSTARSSSSTPTPTTSRRCARAP